MGSGLPTDPQAETPEGQGKPGEKPASKPGETPVAKPGERPAAAPAPADPEAKKKAEQEKQRQAAQKRQAAGRTASNTAHEAMRLVGGLGTMGGTLAGATAASAKGATPKGGAPVEELDDFATAKQPLPGAPSTSGAATAAGGAGSAAAPGASAPAAPSAPGGPQPIRFDDALPGPSGSTAPAASSGAEPATAGKAGAGSEGGAAGSQGSGPAAGGQGAAEPAAAKGGGEGGSGAAESAKGGGQKGAETAEEFLGKGGSKAGEAAGKPGEIAGKVPGQPGGIPKPGGFGGAGGPGGAGAAGAAGLSTAEKVQLGTAAGGLGAAGAGAGVALGADDDRDRKTFVVPSGQPGAAAPPPAAGPAPVPPPATPAPTPTPSPTPQPPPKPETPPTTPPKPPETPKHDAAPAADAPKADAPKPDAAPATDATKAAAGPGEHAPPAGDAKGAAEGAKPHDQAAPGAADAKPKTGDAAAAEHAAAAPGEPAAGAPGAAGAQPGAGAHDAQAGAGGAPGAPGAQAGAPGAAGHDVAADQGVKGDAAAAYGERPPAAPEGAGAHPGAAGAGGTGAAAPPTGAQHVAHVSPQTHAAVDSAPSASSGPKGDGKHAERGAPKPLSIESLKNIAKIIKDDKDKLQAAGKDISKGTFTKEAVDQLVATAKKAFPQLDAKKVEGVVGKLKGLLPARQPDKPGAPVHGPLSQQSAHQIAQAVAQQAPGIDIAALAKRIAGDSRLGGALVNGALNAFGLNAVMGHAQAVHPKFDEAAARHAIMSVQGPMLKGEEGKKEGSAEEKPKGPLSDKTIDQVLGALKKVGIKVDEKDFKKVASTANVVIARKDDLKKVAKAGLSPEAAQKILAIAKEAVPGLSDQVFLKNIDQVSNLYEKNGKSADKVLDKLKELFGGKKPDKKAADEKKTDAPAAHEPGARPGALEDERLKEGGDEAGGPGGGHKLEWKRLAHSSLPAVEPFERHVVAKGDTIKSIAQRAGLDEKKLLAYDGGTGVPNRRRIKSRNPHHLQPGDVLVVPKKGSPPKIQIQAYTYGLKDQTAVTVEIYRQFREMKKDCLATLQGKVKELDPTLGVGIVEVEWKYKYDEKKMGKRPNFIYKLFATVDKEKRQFTSSSSIGIAPDFDKPAAPPKVVKAVWKKLEGKKDEKIDLEAVVQGIPDKSNVFVDVYRRPKRIVVDKTQDLAALAAAGGFAALQAKPGLEAVKAAAPAEEKKGEKHFFEAVFKDAKGTPLKDLQWVVTDPTGKRHEGKLGGDGKIRIEGIAKAGKCKVEFRAVAAKPQGGVADLGWSVKKAKQGQRVILRVRATGFDPGTPVTLRIFESTKSAAEAIATLKSQIDREGIAHVEYEYWHNPNRVKDPRLVYEAEVAGVKATSDVLCITDFFETRVRAEAGPAAGVPIKLVDPVGAVHTVTTDRNGFALAEGPAGAWKVDSPGPGYELA